VILKSFRVASASVLAGWLLVPMAAGAAPSPTPSPALDSVLAEPAGTGFVPDFQAFSAVQGNFEAVDLLVFMGPPKPSETYRLLQDEGFLGGYGRSWFSRTSNHLLLEMVVAFSGGQGATKWLPQARSISESLTNFKSSFQVAGIDNSFGVHFAETSGPFYDDAVGFVKGNDYFFVELFSTKDDLGNLASTQAKAQFDAAPAGTIPTSKWPENATSATPTAASRPNPVGGLPVGLIVIVAVAGVLLVAVAVVAVILVRRTGRPAVPTATVAAVPAPAAAPAPVAPQMSADGYYWWDGQSWRDASLAAPPAAQRSTDGNFWWDGGKWRPMPRAPEPPQPAEPTPAPAASDPPPPSDGS